VAEIDDGDGGIPSRHPRSPRLTKRGGDESGGGGDGGGFVCRAINRRNLTAIGARCKWRNRRIRDGDESGGGDGGLPRHPRSLLSGGRGADGEFDGDGDGVADGVLNW